MGILNKIKGFIKLSEVASDNAQTLLDTATNQDVNTVITQVVNALEDSLRKQSLVVTSTGNISWALNKITPDAGADIVVKLLQNSNGQVVNLVLNNADFLAGVSLPNNGDVFYLELNRSLITTGTISIYNGTGNVGQRAIVGSGLPALVNNQSGGLQGTICIPLAVRQGTNLWWSQSNYYWADGTSGFLGSVGTSAPTPPGTVSMYAGAVAPAGYLLCNGASLPIASYPALFAVIGYTYGGAGLNFLLPNTSGIFVRGAGTQTISAKPFTGVLGAKAVDTTAVNGMSIPNHSHTYTAPNPTVAYAESGGGSYHLEATIPGSSTSTVALPISSPATETTPGNIAFNYIIKV